MANTYTQLYIHLVFAVEHRDRLIHSSFKDELMKYMTGIIQNKGNKLLAINTMPDHGHIFLGLNPKNAISDLAKEVKVSSTDFINEKKWLRGRFHWQEGYGAFSYSHSQIDRVVNIYLTRKNIINAFPFRKNILKCLNHLKLNTRMPIYSNGLMI